MTPVSYCKVCGAELTGFNEEQRIKHFKDDVKNYGGGFWYSTWEYRPTGNIIHHDAVYEDRYVVDQAAYDEQVLVKDAYDEQILVKDAYDEQVLTKAAYDEQVLVKDAYDEQVLVRAAYDEQVLVTPGHWE